jgi:transposase
MRLSEASVELKKGARIVGSERERVLQELSAEYNNGLSVRAIAEKVNRSYGFVSAALHEAGVTMRDRGGNHRENKQA